MSGPPRPLSTLAWVWRLRRADGLMLGFTSHDRPLTIEGLRYRPDPGMQPSALVETAELSPGTLEVEGALGRWLAEQDIAEGRWDDAELTIGLVDWRAPQAFERLAAGVMGELRRPLGVGGRAAAPMVAEIHVDRALGNEVTVCIAPMCRAQLGDGLCRVSLDLHRIEVDLLEIDARHARPLGPVDQPGAWVQGMLRVLDGPGAGLDARVVAADETGFYLDPALAWPVLGPCSARLTQGCDRRFETCHERFGNAANFQGEPHLPGLDALWRYGGG